MIVYSSPYFLKRVSRWCRSPHRAVSHLIVGHIYILAAHMLLVCYVGSQDAIQIGLFCTCKTPWSALKSLSLTCTYKWYHLTASILPMRLRINFQYLFIEDLRPPLEIRKITASPIRRRVCTTELVHIAQDELFEVVEGEMGYVFGGKEGILKQGESANLPAGISHTFWNAHPEKRLVQRVRYFSFNNHPILCIICRQNQWAEIVKIGGIAIKLPLLQLSIPGNSHL